MLNFPTERMEDLVKRVTDREMKLIVARIRRYVLGAVVGGVAGRLMNPDLAVVSSGSSYFQ